jgi:hypothetical protein
VKTKSEPGAGIPARVVRERLVFVEFGARIEKQVQETEAGPVLRMLVSGTKLDSATYSYNGVDVVGERVMPELLASMAEQAKAGGVYLIENHSATLRMGQSIDAAIVDAGDGVEELYVDFLLDVTHPLVPKLLAEIAAGEYVPQCSVGLLVRRVVAFDEEVGGYVGQLTEGHFEHVALTRPDHAAYADAKMDRVFLSGDSLEAAFKSLVESTAAEIAAAESETDLSAEGREGESMKVMVRKLADDPAAANKSADAEAKKTADAEAEAKKTADAEAAKTKAAEDEAAKKDPPPATPADDAADEPEPKKKSHGASVKDLAAHLHDMHNMIKDAADGEGSPADLKELLDDMSSDLEMACEIADGIAGGGADDAPTKEDEAESEAAKKKAAEDEAEAAKKKTADAEARKTADADAGDGEVMKSIDRATRRMARRIERRLATQFGSFESRQKAIEEKLGILAKEPAAPAIRRFNDGTENGNSGEKNETVDAIAEVLKEIKDPKSLDLATRKIAAAIVAQRYSGGAAAK